MTFTIFAVALLLAGVFAWIRLHGNYRKTLFATVAGAEPLIQTKESVFQALSLEPQVDFEKRIVTLTDVLPAELRELMLDEVMNAPGNERSFIPLHKAGGTLSYEALFSVAPTVLAFYHSEYLRKVISTIVGEPVKRTPVWDQSSCSILCYTEPGDRIGWHYDHNFYKGRHFTILYVLENVGPTGLSSATLQTRKQGEVTSVPTPAGTLVVFEGSQVFHRVTALGGHENRILLSMTFTTDSQNNWLQGVLRRMKDTAYYGLRALWT